MEIEKMNMQKVEKEQVENEEEDDDDGPPPGFQCIITQPPHVEKVEEADDEDEGPPPGFDSVAPKPTPSLPLSVMENSSIQQDTEDEDDDDDGPPPGWEFSSLAHALPKPESNTTDIKVERNEELNENEVEDENKNEDEDEGPPPGWETVLLHQMKLPCAPSLQPALAVSSDLKTESKQDITRNDDVEPHSVSESTLMQERSSPPIQPLQPLPSSSLSDEMKSKEEDPKIGGKWPTAGKQSASPKQLLPPTPHPSTPPAASSSSEKAQLVCGTCQKLLLYPRGAKWVQCPSCQEVNFVLEANEVGQVKCGGCSTLLMYPYGAPAVQCTSCRFVTEIGANNRRPPLSVQQAQRRGNRRRNRAR